jgi:hypothetical protein
MRAYVTDAIPVIHKPVIKTPVRTIAIRNLESGINLRKDAMIANLVAAMAQA